MKLNDARAHKIKAKLRLNHELTVVEYFSVIKISHSLDMSASLIDYVKKKKRNGVNVEENHLSTLGEFLKKNYLHIL